MTYIPTIGLEVHAELTTASKMFCGCANNPEIDRPNEHVCPICMGHPGTLPVINREAVRHVLRIGAAVEGSLADFTEFDRKNYFYPDIPKAYQISQYAYPLVAGGVLSGVALTRIHLEEDTARSVHDRGDASLVDFNRAGVPLMELVTEPVIHDAQTAVSFGRDLQILLRFLGASEANMERGQLRVEANISVAPEGADLGTKVEVKNLNSFRAAERAIGFEIKRQETILKDGGTVVQETRGWDENKEVTVPQRRKEVAHDYRYFPDPDLPKLQLSRAARLSEPEIRADLPELPWEFSARLARKGVHPEKVAVLLTEEPIQALYQRVCAEARPDEVVHDLLVNYLTSDVLGLLNSGAVPPEQLRGRDAHELVSILTMVQVGDLSSRGAKDLLPIWLREGGEPKKLANEHGLLQQSDAGAIEALAQEIVGEHPGVAEEYRGGKEASLQFLVGQGMKKTKGAANPKLLAKALQEQLA